MGTETSLAYKELRGYLAAPDKFGELRRVTGAVDDLASLSFRCD